MSELMQPQQQQQQQTPVTPQDLDWVFQELDPQNTGFVPVDKFYEFITKDQPPQHCIAHTASYIMGLFANTRAGQLSRTELAGYINLCKTGTRLDQYRIIFRDAGRRRPGLLSQKELADLIETQYQQALRPDFEDIFDNCDEDTDGWLTEEEFVRFVEIYEL